MEHASSVDGFPSQFETNEQRQRIVLLGASNLSIMFPHVIKTLRATFAQPLDMVIAKGPGRSYGQESKIFRKKFLGILQCGLWDALAGSPARKTRAIVADIGNDLAYEASVEQIVAWVETVLDRLMEDKADLVLNNIPLESLGKVGELRFRVLKRILFPRCSLSRSELMRRAEGLAASLERIADERKVPIFSGKIEWYGIDPIHPRRAHAGLIWQQMIGAIASSRDVVELHRAGLRESLQLHGLQPQAWIERGAARTASQPIARFEDGTTISLY